VPIHINPWSSCDILATALWVGIFFRLVNWYFLNELSCPIANGTFTRNKTRIKEKAALFLKLLSRYRDLTGLKQLAGKLFK